MSDDIRTVRDRQRDAPGLRGLVRRMLVSLTSAGGLWQLLGKEDGDGNRERASDVEAFQQIGFLSRPAAGSRAEGVVVKVGGESGHPVVIASRDRAIEIAIGEDETVIFNSTGTLVKITAGGRVELGEAGLGTTDGVVHGTGIDPWTGATYTALGNTSDMVRAKK